MPTGSTANRPTGLFSSKRPPSGNARAGELGTTRTRSASPARHRGPLVKQCPERRSPSGAT